MATCYRCQSETQLYDNGIPICLTCSEPSSPKSESATNQGERVDDFKLGRLDRTTANE